jgi:oligosaccharyltransferase complex subunit beta
VNETSPSESYTINDRVVRSLSVLFVTLDVRGLYVAFGIQVFTASISKYDPKKSAWEPYSGIQDLQLEFTMLDPHIRTTLPPVPGSPGKYSVTFRVPDRHGVFKFIIDHKRKG